MLKASQDLNNSLFFLFFDAENFDDGKNVKSY